ncbi:hypothetical protein Tmz1t_2863 [Thauera aminoaromatica]|uniref:Uncharacterized protein n=1 Tax=Thauera aminoaromatica TaxID=164330 RepID=C4KAN6_THASP|nr:hypothetical protein Tmz1t_2863 [Thauera aminoaromatica]
MNGILEAIKLLFINLKLGLKCHPVTWVSFGKFINLIQRFTRWIFNTQQINCLRCLWVEKSRLEKSPLAL